MLKEDFKLYYIEVLTIAYINSGGIIFLGGGVKSKFEQIVSEIPIADDV